MPLTPVKLGLDSGTALDYYIKPGTRHMREAPYFVQRFATGELSHRGDAFWQHFVQAGFRGGMGQDEFQDIEMVQSMLGLDGSHEGKLVPWWRFSQKLAPAATGGYWAYTWRPRIFQTQTDNASLEYDAQRTIFACDLVGTQAAPAKVYWSQNHGATWSSRNMSTQTDAYQGITASTHFLNVDTRVVRQVFGDRYGKIHYCVNAADAGSWTTLANTPLDTQRAITAMVTFMGKLYVAQNNKVWTWDGKADALANWSSKPVFISDVHITCATIWNGAVWFGGYQSFHGKLLRLDGVAAMEVASFNENFNVFSLMPYDGSLYVGGASYDEKKQRHVGRVYRFNGASIRELDLGKAGIKKQAGFLQGVWDMCVFEGKLLMPAADFSGVLAYDAREDAFYRMPRVDPSVSVTEPDYEMVFGMAVFEGQLFLSVPKLGVYKYDVGTLADSATYTGVYYFDSSWYDADIPLVDKRWQDVTVDIDGVMGTDTVEVSYRIDENDAFALLGSMSAATRTISLPDNTLGKRIQLRFDFSHQDQSGEPTWRFKGYYVRYTVEPRVRRNWSLTLLCADNIELPDGVTREARTGVQMREALWDLRETRDLVYFRDVDGVEYTCVIDGVSEYQHSVNYTDGYEGVFSISLWEV